MDRPATPPICPNCGLAAEGAFCSGCGQDNRHGRLQTRDLLGEVLQHATVLDTTLGRTLVGLVKQPGRLAAEYVEGRRARYVSPLRLFLGAIALFLLAHRLSGLSLDAGLGMGINIESSGDVVDRAAAARAFIAGHMDLVVVLALPVVALFQRWLFRGRGRNYAENVVYLLYLQGQLFLYGIVLLGLGAWRPTAVVPARILCHLVLLGVGNRGFYGTGWPRSLLLGVVGTIGYLLITGLAAALVIVTIFVVLR